MDATAKTRIFGPFLDWALDMPAEISARYLREIGVTAPDAVAPLISPLLSHAESDKRQKAAWAAGILHDDSLAEPLLALLGDSVAEVRAAAARALGALAASVAFDKLLHGLKHDPNSAVRAACAEALGDLSDQLAVPALIDALNDSNQFVVNASAVAFRGIDPRGWLSLLAAAHGSGLPPRVQAAFLAAWPMLITPTAAETLLADPEPDVRRTAIQAIWLSAERKFLPLFERVLSDADEAVRFWAVSALAGQEATISVPLLERSARDREDFVVAVALRELAQIDNKRALDLLFERMASGVPFSEWIKVAEIDIVSRRGSAGSAAQGLALAVQRRIPFPLAKENALMHLWRFADLGPEALSQQRPDSEPEPEESPGGDTA
jgi:HEAT repeat protein